MFKSFTTQSLIEIVKKIAKTLIVIAFVVIFLAQSIPANAAPGDIDNSFENINGFNGIIYSTAIQNDRKIVAGGNFTDYNGVTANRIIRLNLDGSRDTSFNIGTGFNWIVFDLSIQSDGKILVGGDFDLYNGFSARKVTRLNSDGGRDTSFGIGSGFNSSVHSIFIQSDGKVVVGGDFTNYNNDTTNRLIRLNSDGGRDTSFDVGSGFSGSIRNIKTQSDGKIVLGGHFS